MIGLINHWKVVTATASKARFDLNGFAFDAREIL